MTIASGHTVRRFSQLGAGEIVARLASITSIILLGHLYGAIALAAFALGQALTLYLQPAIDFGLRHIGARLVAVYPDALAPIIQRIQRRRIGMAAAALPILLIYAFSTDLSHSMRIFVFLFSAMGGFYALSLDWAAWGLGDLQVVGFARAIVPVSILACLLAGIASHTSVMWWLVAGNAVGGLILAAFTARWWKRQAASSTYTAEVEHEIDASIRWTRTSIVGTAWLCTVAFNTIDTLMLGVMSNAHQVGFYTASYRIINQVLGAYYLVTQMMYPRLARQTLDTTKIKVGWRLIALLVVTGVICAAGIASCRGFLLNLLFGHEFLNAAPLLLILAWAIPFDFVVSWFNNAYLAWGLERKVLVCTAVAAGANILLNLFFIRRYGALAASVNTVVSYVIYLTSLAIVEFRRRRLVLAS